MKIDPARRGDLGLGGRCRTGRSGRRQILRRLPRRRVAPRAPDWRVGVRAYALDPERAKALWAKSEEWSASVSRKLAGQRRCRGNVPLPGNGLPRSPVRGGRSSAAVCCAHLSRFLTRRRGYNAAHAPGHAAGTRSHCPRAQPQHRASRTGRAGFAGRRHGPGHGLGRRLAALRHGLPGLSAPGIAPTRQAVDPVRHW